MLIESHCFNSSGSDEDQSIVPFPNAPSIVKILRKFTIPTHPSQLSTKPNGSGLVLTNVEN